MRARVLHLGVTGAASALLLGGLLPAAAVAAPGDGSRATAVTDLKVEVVVDNAAPFVGQAAVFTVRVTNIGGADSEGDFVLTNTLPTSFVFDSVVSMGPGVTCPGTPLVGTTGPVICNLPVITTVLPNFRDIQIRAIAQTVGPGSNQVVLTPSPAGDDTVAANNTDAVSVDVPPAPTEAPDPGEPGDPGYPHGWSHGGGYGYGGYGYGGYGYGGYGYGGYGDYCDYGCY